jgi:hypothetical protein
MTDDQATDDRPPPVKFLHDASRFEDPDAYYAALVKKLEAAGDDDAVRFLCRLTLVLANEIGRHETLLAALELAAKKI